MKRCTFLLVGLGVAVSGVRAADHPPAAPRGAGPAPAVVVAEQAAGAKARVSAEEAMQRLLDGNDRFRYDESTFPRYGAARRAETFADGQKPIAAVLSCADSRAPVEAIFDQGIGDLFVVRVAGNVADTDEIGTIEYGVGHLEIPLIVVLGHGKCGAVTAVAENADVHGHVRALVDNIAPAVASVRARDPQAAGNRLVRLAIRANVMQSMKDLLENSSTIASAVKGGKVKLVGGVYDLQTGGIDWLGSHPREAELIRDQKPADDHAKSQPSARRADGDPAAVHGDEADHAPDAEPGANPHDADHLTVPEKPHASAAGVRKENWTVLIALLSVSTLASGATIHYAYGRSGT